jgi:predicted dehydrogenase
MSGDDSLSVGVHGLGWAAGAHIESFKDIEDAQVTGACSRRELDRDKLEMEYGIPITPYSEYEEMLRDESIDIIDICSPGHVHAEQAIAAARAGKDIILEKPIALTWEDAVRLKEVIDETGVNVCVCFEVRFSEQAETLRSAIDDELLGDLHYAEVDYYHAAGPWYDNFSWTIKKEGGGSSLLSAGCHAVDLLLWYMDVPVKEVTSYSTKSDGDYFESYEYDTTSVTIIRFEDSSVGKVASVVDCLQPYYFGMHLIGSQGTVLDDKFYTEQLDGLNRDSWSEFGTPLVESGDVEHHPYLPQFRQFVESLQAGDKMPRTDFETAFESHRIVFAADRSAAEDRTVSLSEFDL